jgi:hypothetical protein
MDLDGVEEIAFLSVLRIPSFWKDRARRISRGEEVMESSSLATDDADDTDRMEAGLLCMLLSESES